MRRYLKKVFPNRMGWQRMTCTLLNPSVRSQLDNLNDREHLTCFITPSLESFHHRLSQFSPNVPTTSSQPPWLAQQHVSKLSEFQVPHASDLETFFAYTPLVTFSDNLKTIYVLMAPKFLSET